MSKKEKIYNYGMLAKTLKFRWRIGKYGISFGRSIRPDGKRYGWKFVHIVPLDGWIFNPSVIVQHMADNGELTVSKDQFSVSLSDDKKEEIHE